MSSVFEEAWEGLEKYYKTYLGERRVFIAYEVICKMQECLDKARKRAKEYQEEQKKEWAEEKGSKRWLEEQGD